MMSQPLNIGDSHFLDDSGNFISTKFIDLRDPEDRKPITTLIKGCCKRYALENGETIRLSKPEKFRKAGEDLISDLSEMYFSHREESVVVDDPNDLAEAQLLKDEQNRAAELLQLGTKVTTNSIKRTHTSTHSLSYGKNGWIYCTSIEPLNQEGQDRWWKALNENRALDEQYDHISYIHRPREFVRALGSMVTEQLGPQGRESELTQSLKHSFEGEFKNSAFHKTELIFHGPVIYVDDPYEKISNAPSLILAALWAIFVKGIQYQDQREYRFAIWTEEEPSEKCVDLNISPALLGALRERHAEVSQQTVSEKPLSETNSDFQDTRQDPVDGPTTEKASEPPNSQDGKRRYRSLMDIVIDPSTPIAPHPYTGADPPEDVHEKTTTYAVLSALRLAVEKFSGKRRIDAASSAWHAEPCIRGLCSRFEDPIKNVAVIDDNSIVVNVKFPQGSRSKAKIVFGPLGTSTYKIEDGRATPPRGRERGLATFPPLPEILRAT